MDFTASQTDYVDSGHIRLGQEALFMPKSMEILDYRSAASKPASPPAAVSVERYAPYLGEYGHCLRDQALAVCSHAGSHEVAELRATSLPTLVQMVAADQGVTLLPEMAAAVLAGRGSGVAATRMSPPPGREVGLVWRMSSARGLGLGLLAELLRAQAGKHLAPLRKK